MLAETLDAVEPLLVGQADMALVVAPLGSVETAYPHQLAIKPRAAWLRDVGVIFDMVVDDDGVDRPRVTVVNLTFATPVPLRLLSERYGAAEVLQDLHWRESPPVAFFPPMPHPHGVLKVEGTLAETVFDEQGLADLRLEWTPTP